jgi:hypothetical protein
MRLAPVAPVHAYRTYQIVTPLATHFRPASCEEVDCPDYLQGWVTKLDESTPEGQGHAAFIRRELRGRYSFTEDREPAGLTAFTFPPGQACFRQRQHRTRIDRPEHFLRRDGDWRGNPTGAVRRHTSAADWQEDFAEHQDRIATAIERG